MMKSDLNFDVVFYEAFEEEEIELKKFLPKNKRYHFTWKTIQESGHKYPPASVVSIRTQSQLPLEWKTHLDAIITRSTGYDHISEYLKKADIDIPAAYLPDYAGRAVAEQAMLLWTSLIRKLPEQQLAFKTFSRDGLTGYELVDKTITVAGVGRIGSQITDIAKGLKMNVQGVDIAPDDSTGIKYVSMKKGVASADIFVCALPLTAITEKMLNFNLLKNIKPGAVFINIARGEISPPEDLLRLLRQGIIAGIGLDVFEYEKELAGIIRDGKKLEAIKDIKIRNSVAASLELIDHPGVITTPHNAFNTRESVERKSLHTAQNFAEFAKTGAFLTPLPS